MGFLLRFKQLFSIIGNLYSSELQERQDPNLVWKFQSSKQSCQRVDISLALWAQFFCSFSVCSFLARLGFLQAHSRKRRAVDGLKNVFLAFGQNKENSHFDSGQTGHFTFSYWPFSFAKLVEEEEVKKAWWRCPWRFCLWPKHEAEERPLVSAWLRPMHVLFKRGWVEVAIRMIPIKKGVGGKNSNSQPWLNLFPVVVFWPLNGRPVSLLPLLFWSNLEVKNQISFIWRSSLGNCGCTGRDHLLVVQLK